MKIQESVRNGYVSAQETLSHHRVFAVLLLGLFAMAGTGNFLTGELINRGVTGLVISLAGKDEKDELRACNGQHTIFQDMEVLDDVQKAYFREMNGIFTEREEILKNSAEWICDKDSDALTSMPMLRSLAVRLPGWHVIPEPPDGPMVQRPVTLAAFGSIAAELQREYECKLFELNDRSIALMTRNKDLAPGKFCCANQGCTATNNVFECVGPQTDDSQCDQACEVYLTQIEIATRLPAISDTLAIERQHSRMALDRALQTMRSFDINFLIARELTCYQRASLDLRNEFNLLADTVSCMPKIWDAVTSIHDRKELP